MYIPMVIYIYGNLENVVRNYSDPSSGVKLRRMDLDDRQSCLQSSPPSKEK